MIDRSFLDAVDKVNFKLSGGWPGLFGRLVGSALKWIGIGCAFHLGWRIWG